jgi:hypothetical protein
MYDRERNGDKEYRARFRFGRPDSNVYPYGRDTPDDVFPYCDHDETDEVHEKDDTESSPLMVRVLIRLARFPSVTKFNADEIVRVRSLVAEITVLTRANMGT